MNESLDEALLSCGVNCTDAATNIVVCDSSDVSGQFLTTELLCKNLASERRVLFVSLYHTFAHHCNVAAKRGIKLLNYYRDGRIKVIEGQMLMAEAAGKVLEGHDISKHPFSFMFNDCDKSLKNLFLSIRFCINDWRSSGDNFVIFIDHLSVLLSLGISCTEVRILVQNCASLCNSTHSASQHVGSIIVVTLDDPLDSESQLVVKHLCRWFNATLAVKPLSTGKTSDVDGSLQIRFKPPGKTQNSVKKIYLFKVLDRTTKLFAPGMSASML